MRISCILPSGGGQSAKHDDAALVVVLHDPPDRAHDVRPKRKNSLKLHIALETEFPISRAMFFLEIFTILSSASNPDWRSSVLP